MGIQSSSQHVSYGFWKLLNLSFALSLICSGNMGSRTLYLGPHGLYIVESSWTFFFQSILNFARDAQCHCICLEFLWTKCLGAIKGRCRPGLRTTEFCLFHRWSCSVDLIKPLEVVCGRVRSSCNENYCLKYGGNDSKVEKGGLPSLSRWRAQVPSRAF